MSLYDDIVTAQATLAREQQELAIAQAEFNAAQATYNALLAQSLAPSPDLSQFNGSITWTALGDAADFAFLRIADGDVRDTSWNRTRLDSARSAGLPVGPYYYGRVASVGNEQRNGRSEAAMAIYFAESAGWGKPGDLPLAYDFETLNGQTAAKAAQHVVEFARTYEYIKGHLPIVYTNPATWNLVASQFNTANSAWLGLCPLWIAHWDVTTPSVPTTWSNWTFWQYTDKGSIAGVTGAVDLNRFAGTITELTALKIT